MRVRTRVNNVLTREGGFLTTDYVSHRLELHPQREASNGRRRIDEYTEQRRAEGYNEQARGRG